MRILKLHHPIGHPYWQAEEYKVELPNGEFVNISPHFIQGNHGGYRIYNKDGDIYFQQCASGSGYGKVDMETKPPILLVRKSKYDKIEYVGEKKEMPEELKNDLKANNL